MRNLIVADFIFIGVAAVVAFLGWLIGFGKTLKFFTSGIFGILISVFVCYCLGGIIMNIGFVSDLLAKLAAVWGGKEGFFYEFLTKIRLEIVIYYVVLFVLVQLFRVIIVSALKNIAESEAKLMKIINRFFGAALLLCMGFLITLFVFQIIIWVGGSTLQNVKESFAGSALKLDYIFFDGNPLMHIVGYIKNLVA